MHSRARPDPAVSASQKGVDGGVHANDDGGMVMRVVL
jgi:hypothetical protein